MHAGDVIAAICGDAGGAAAVLPVVEALRGDGRVAIRPMGYGLALAAWQARAIDAEAIDETVSPEAVDDLLAGVSLVLAATSVNAIMLENKFVAAANRRAIPSIAVLDSWSHYVERFGPPSGPSVPTRVAVMDARARGEMIADGFEPSRLIITGQPAFDDLMRARQRFGDDARRALRRAWGAGESHVVLFVSQPLGERRTASMTSLICALEHVARRSGQPITLVVRPHPREDRAPLERLASADIRIIVSSAGDPREAVLAADLVTGMNSILLMHACYLECVTLSLQPGLDGPDLLPSNARGLSRAAYEESAVLPAVEELLLNEDSRAAARKRLAAAAPAPDAARRVASLVYDMLGGQS